MRRIVRRFAAVGASAVLALPLMSANFGSLRQGVPSGTVVAGRALTSTGHPVSGMTVSLLAWPTNRALRQLKVGAQVPQVTVDTVTTSADGRYDLSVPEPKKLVADTASNGVVNFEVVGETAKGFVDSYFWRVVCQGSLA
jgi:hypothetical protein